jgi:hypothetical protein
MADRTTQPATEVGINPIYSANARFLWNAAVPNKNSLDSSNSTSGLTGNDNTGTVGKYRTWPTSASEMVFALTPPTGAYTLVVVHVFPTASLGSATTFSTFSGTGVQCVPYTTGGGVYENFTHRGAAGSVNNQVTGVGGFNTAGWVEVFAFTGSGGSPANQLRRYRKSGSGVETQGTETISYVSPSSNVYLGDNGGVATQGLAAVMWIAEDVGATECEELRDNPWRMFEPEVTAGFAAGATLGALEAGGSLSAIASAFVAGATLGSITAGGTLGPAPGVITSPPLRTNNGTLLASTALDYVDVYLESSGVFVGRFTGLSTNAGGAFTVTSALLTPGTAYKLDWRTGAGHRRMPAATAA